MSSPGPTARAALGGAGVLGVTLLIAGFAINPGPAAADSTSQLLAYGHAHHGSLLVGGWLQVTGTTVICLFALAMATLAGFDRLCIPVLIVGLTALLAVSLSEMACYVGLASGHGETARVAADLIPGVQHGYSIVAAPLVFAALGTGLLRCAAPRRALGITALGFGAVFWTLGLIGVLTAVQGVVDFFAGFQALWWLAAALVVGIKRPWPGRATPA
ncbi:MAG: hypothetical protein M0Z40_03230 [Actinomycetota bacterium]|nr:hypothetical protein [Actinomycetota bacterium]